ncbi:hypothetical protein BS17DRAFT_351286 [Gyrodon lividus]|nr:hypothetical protein BS17DRAFT_351286 [Gyrodon lividus]
MKPADVLLTYLISLLAALFIMVMLSPLHLPAPSLPCYARCIRDSAAASHHDGRVPPEKALGDLGTELCVPPISDYYLLVSYSYWVFNGFQSGGH